MLYPLSYEGEKVYEVYTVGAGGFARWARVVARNAPTILTPAKTKTLVFLRLFYRIVYTVGAGGFEPSTVCLRGNCSTN